MPRRRLVLIGAARSGTKILRDALAAATGVGKVPYDVGYVWRFGSEDTPDDVLDPLAVTERTRAFIQRFVDGYACGQCEAVVIEKTVGNAVRVPMVANVLPDARYIHLIRDGVDVIESTRRQWTAPTDLHYLVGKARHFPLRLLPGYGVKYLRSLSHRRATSEGRVGSWGLRYPGIDNDLQQHELLVVCARQWRYGVTLARTDLARLKLPVVEVRYEDLVHDPGGQLDRVAQFAGLHVSTASLVAAGSAIYTTSQGLGRSAFNRADAATVDREVGDLLSDLGYDSAGR